MARQLRGAVEMSAAMGISGTIGWVVVRSGQPLVDLLFWRCAFGAATLLAVCAALGLLRSGRWTLRVVALAVLGGVALVLNWLLIFASYSHASISIATAVYNTQPFMLVGLGAVFFAERLTRTQLAWLGMAFAGLLLIADVRPGSGESPGTSSVAGILMALGAAFFYAIAAVVARQLKHTPPHLIALIQVCVGALMLAPFAHLAKLPTAAGTWGVHIAMGVVYTGLVFTLLYGAIQKLPTPVAGALSFIYPVVAIGVDFVAFGQRLHPTQLAGVAVILLAAAGMTLGWTLPGLDERRAGPPAANDPQR